MKAKDLLTVISHNGNDIIDKIGSLCTFGLSFSYDENEDSMDVEFEIQWGDEIFEGDREIDNYVCVLDSGECEEFSWENEFDFYLEMKEYLLNLWDSSTDSTKDKIFQKVLQNYEEHKKMGINYKGSTIDESLFMMLLEEN